MKNQLGNYLAEQGRPLEAAKYYLAAIELDPQEPLYRLQLGNLLSAARDPLLKSPDWTRATFDRAMLDAFAMAVKKASAPDNLVMLPIATPRPLARSSIPTGTPPGRRGGRWSRG